jgi:hypothetical protein
MGKQNGPPVPNPFVKVDGTLRRLRGKIGRFFADMNRHNYLLSNIFGICGYGYR